MSINIGIDLGSTAIKVVGLEDGQLIFRCQTPTRPGQEKLAQELISEALTEIGRSPNDISRMTATGYGRRLYSKAKTTVDEISANALGLFSLSGGRVKTIINIGGQDLKIMFLSDQGQVTDFRMNDKCAAGTGRFFELAARLLDTPLSQFGEISRQSDTELVLNNTCVVFAETEIVSLMAKGVKKGDIIKALNYSVARRVAALIGPTLGEGEIYLDGGPAHNHGLLEALEDELMSPVNILAEPQYTVAYGAALINP